MRGTPLTNGCEIRGVSSWPVAPRKGCEIRSVSSWPRKETPCDFKTTSAE